MQELSEKLRRLNIELVVPAFERFDNVRLEFCDWMIPWQANPSSPPPQAYRFSGFSQKNPQKYLKYMASDVESLLKTFFSGAG